ncbi:MAG: hypothetical protein A3G18_02600 [Rhodospirillales bacterium RIFCSPLOWO2_12_FULL_58_28]|nr:MAG: hypothetical protein A3H92_06640 [Rhodospirillales bacterium RIFCSPLOWO2_02_FULL_58_16]OHC78941.1 MAG: hypothetical protein A3G18_02600 [Rhodospirillales bacterium RIFCSPLOWO2_12_FULL_58_28]
MQNAPLTGQEIEALYQSLSKSRTGVVTHSAAIAKAGTIPPLANLNHAILIADEFSRHAPPEIAIKVAGALKQATTNPQTVIDIARYILAFAAEHNMTAFYDAYTDKYYQRYLALRLEQFAATVNDAHALKASAGTIVFVANTAFMLIAREALYLRRNGFKVFLVLVGGIPDNLARLFRICFDDILEYVGNPEFLRRAIMALEPDIFHVQCWMWSYHVARMICESKRNAKCVCEFYDITSIYAARNELAAVWSPKIVDLDIACEKWLFQHADAIVHRFPEPVIAELYGAEPLQLEMQMYPCPEYVSYNNEKLSSEDGILRMVYAGGLVPKTDAHPESLFPERNHAEAFRKLLEQGFGIDIFMSPFRSLQESGLDALHELTREFPLFRMLPGEAPDKLAGIISAYDFGLILTDMDISKNRNTVHQLKSAAGTKLFIYAEAGIPVIVNAEYEYMTSIVERHGIGFGLPSQDIATAGPRIRAFDRAEAQENIRRFNSENGMDTHIHRLISLYRKAAPNRHG